MKKICNAIKFIISCDGKLILYKQHRLKYSFAIVYDTVYIQHISTRHIPSFLVVTFYNISRGFKHTFRITETWPR